MSATAEATGRPGHKARSAGASSVSNRVQARLHRSRLDKALASGADPNTDPLRRERAGQLVGEKRRRKLAASLEGLLAEADSAPRPFTSKVPIARAAIRDSRWDVETIVERLKAPAYISAQGVAMASLLLTSGTSPCYGTDRASSQELRWALQATVEAIDHGPVLVG